MLMDLNINNIKELSVEQGSMRALMIEVSWKKLKQIQSHATSITSSYLAALKPELLMERLFETLQLYLYMKEGFSHQLSIL